MKKTLLLFSAVLLVSSCVIDEDTDNSHTSYYLKELSASFFDNSVDLGIRYLQSLIAEGKAVNETGFEASALGNGNYYEDLFVTRVSDNLWSVKGEGGPITFAMNVSRSLSSEVEADKFTCSEVSAKWVDGEYSAVLSMEDGALYDWTQSFSQTSINWSLEPSCEYEVKYFSAGKQTDWCRVVITMGRKDYLIR